MNYRNSKKKPHYRQRDRDHLSGIYASFFITCSILGHNILKQRMGVKLIRRSAS